MRISINCKLNLFIRITVANTFAHKNASSDDNNVFFLFVSFNY